MHKQLTLWPSLQYIETISHIKPRAQSTTLFPFISASTMTFRSFYGNETYLDVLRSVLFELCLLWHIFPSRIWIHCCYFLSTENSTQKLKSMILNIWPHTFQSWNNSNIYYNGKNCNIETSSHEDCWFVLIVHDWLWHRNWCVRELFASSEIFNGSFKRIENCIKMGICHEIIQ